MLGNSYFGSAYFGGDSLSDVVATQTVAGHSRIALVGTHPQTGVSRVALVTLRTQTGKASVKVSTLRTQAGVGRIALISTHTQPATARIALVTTKPITGVARIGYVTSKTVTGVSRVTATILRTQTGKSKLVTAVTNLFTDGFEDGTVNAWSNPHTDGGKMSVTTGAKLVGDYGLSILIDNTNDKYIFDETPNLETQYRFSFHIDPNSLVMAENDEILIADVNDHNYVTKLKVSLSYKSGHYAIQVTCFAGADDNRISDYYPITDAPHRIEVDWMAATSGTANDGECNFWIDGLLQQSLTMVDNYFDVSLVVFGAQQIDAGTSGTLYLDEFASNNTRVPIGQILSNPKINLPGLGMVMSWGWLTSEVSGNVTDILLANNIRYMRQVDDWNVADRPALAKAAVVSAVGKGALVTYGVNQETALTAANWSDYRTAVLVAALWAQNNGVFEFQLGNEMEYRVDGTTLTISQLITNLQSLATDVKTIFTNGNISYAVSEGHVDNWITNGSLGDINLLGINVYYGDVNFSEWWRNQINKVITAFGLDHIYLTEFNVSSVSLASYSTDESVQATEIYLMLKHIQDAGIKRAYYYEFYSDYFGALKYDGTTYRQLWSTLLDALPLFKNQVGLARIGYVTTKVQTGHARVGYVTVKTITGVSRVQLVTIRTLQGVSRLTNSATRTQTGLAAVLKATARTQAGIATIQGQEVLDKTQAGKAAILKATTRTISGLSSIRRTTSKSQLGKARIAIVTGVIQTGHSRIGYVTSKMITGHTRVQTSPLRTISGVGRITVSYTRTQTGKSVVLRTVLRTQAGIASIQAQAIIPQSQSGKAAISKTVTRTLTGVARVEFTTTTAQLGKARIALVSPKTQLGKARLALITTKTQQGRSRVGHITPQNVTGTSRIATIVAKYQTGHTRIQRSVLRQTIGTARVQRSVAQTIIGIARVQVSTAQSIQGVAHVYLIWNRNVLGRTSVFHQLAERQYGISAIVPRDKRRHVYPGRSDGASTRGNGIISVGRG